MCRSVRPRSAYMRASMASMSALSRTRKLLGYWTAWLSSCKTVTQKLWKVQMWPVSLSPVRARMRWRISAADLLVKVTQSMLPGVTPSSFTR